MAEHTTDEKKKLPTPEEVRELAAKLETLSKALPPRHFMGIGQGHRFQHLVHEMESVAVDLEERARPGSHASFRFTTTAQVRLHVLLSEPTKEDFESFLRQSEIKYQGGGGSGSGIEWSMNHYFTSSEHLERATAWLREKGAQHTTEEVLEAEYEAKWQAMRTSGPQR
jgi:hypothetical protein